MGTVEVCCSGCQRASERKKERQCGLGGNGGVRALDFGLRGQANRTRQRGTEGWEVLSKRAISIIETSSASTPPASLSVMIVTTEVSI